MTGASRRRQATRGVRVQPWSGVRERPADDRRHRWPATEPITVEALTYGRHASPERWLPRPPREAPTMFPAPPPGAVRAAGWRDWWRAVRDAGVRLAAGRGPAS